VQELRRDAPRQGAAGGLGNDLMGRTAP
jgi:hypothetical protein